MRQKKKIPTRELWMVTAIMLSAMCAVVAVAFIASRFLNPLVGKPILPDLNPDDVACIEYDGKKLATLHEGKWIVDAYDGYPADPAKVKWFLDDLSKMTVREVEDDPAVCRRVMSNPLTMTLRDSHGQVLGEVEFGERHGRVWSGFVESAFVYDGRYLFFMGKTVVVNEQFRIFEGHHVRIDGLCRDWKRTIPDFKFPSLGEDVQVVISVSIMDKSETIVVKKRLSWIDGSCSEKFAWTFDVEGLSPGESVNVDSVSSFMDSFWWFHFHEVKMSSHFPKFELTGAKRCRTFAVDVSDGTPHCTQTLELYDCESGFYVEMQGWVYTVDRDTAEKLFAKRGDLIVSADEWHSRKVK